MTAAMMMMVSLGLEAQIRGAIEPGVQQAPNNNVDGRNTKAFDWDGLRAQLKVRIVEIVPQRLVTKVFVAFKHQRIMMTFGVVMTTVMAMCAMEMIMNTTTMCRMEMIKRLPTMLVLVVT
jgi:hypothetical protein